MSDIVLRFRKKILKGKEGISPLYFVGALSNRPVQVVVTPNKNYVGYMTSENSSIYKDNDLRIAASEQGHMDRVLKQEADNLRIHDQVIRTLDYIPLIGDGIEGYNIFDNLNKGNYSQAGLGIAMFLLPAGISKFGKSLYKEGKLLYNTYKLSSKLDKNFIPEYKVYLNNPRLWDIGTFKEYNDYLTTIFPESKYLKIAYHGGPKGITKFKVGKNKKINTGTRDYGIYFASDEDLAKCYADAQKRNNRLTYFVKLNAPNLMRYDNPNFIQRFTGLDQLRFTPDAINQYWYDRLNLNKYNGIIQNKSGSPFSRGQITMFNPEDIHILGDSKDASDFYKWKLDPKVYLIKDINVPNTPALYNITPKSVITSISNLALPVGIPATSVGFGGYYLLKPYLSELHNSENSNKEINKKIK